jgi:threonine dehydrogenase-like Zn-dependent dehydrogenase
MFMQLSHHLTDIAKSLGATDTINYHKETVADYVKRLTDGKGFDIVFDTVGGENIDKSIEAIKLYGQVITIQTANANPNLGALQLKSGTLHVVFMLLPLIYNIQRERHGEILKQITHSTLSNFRLKMWVMLMPYWSQEKPWGKLWFIALKLNCTLIKCFYDWLAIVTPVYH